MIGPLITTYILGALTYWMLGFVGQLRDDVRQLAGETTLWPLYAIRFLAWALFDALKALGSRPA